MNFSRVSSTKSGHSTRNRYNARFSTSPRKLKMKLHSIPNQPYQTVTAYDESSVEINAIVFKHSLIVLPELPPIVWTVNSFADLTEDHFKTIAAFHPDVVILGTGAKQQFSHPKLTACLINQRIGVECMDSQAACRTYNILMTEGRKVALALIMEKGTNT
jgi:uncharacterized protein